jgi:hypothetical protein
MNQLPSTPYSGEAPNPFRAAPSAEYRPGVAIPKQEFNPFENNPFRSGSAPQESFALPQSTQLSERLREKIRPVTELGRRAVSRLVEFKNSDYGQKLTGMVRGAASETAMAAALSGARSLGERFGVNYENGELSVKKTKLARAAVRLAMNPYGEATKAVKTAGMDAYRAGRQEARSHMYAAGNTLANDAFGYARRRVA